MIYSVYPTYWTVFRTHARTCTHTLRLKMLKIHIHFNTYVYCTLFQHLLFQMNAPFIISQTSMYLASECFCKPLYHLICSTIVTYLGLITAICQNQALNVFLSVCLWVVPPHKMFLSASLTAEMIAILSGDLKHMLQERKIKEGSAFSRWTHRSHCCVYEEYLRHRRL